MLLFVKAVFWTSLLMVVYHYLLYPLVLWAYNSLFRRNIHLHTEENYQPKVTYIISAYNEAAVIGKKLENALELDYPPEKLEILVVSDASTDGTDDIVRQWRRKAPHIKLLRMLERRGKTHGLNKALEQAQGEIVVFSDANALYEKNAIRELVKYFADERVGFVVGNALYYDSKEAAAENENLYWQYEILVKQLESRFYSISVGDGAIYAIRKELYQKLDEDDIGDFVNPLQIAARGYLGIYNTNAICYEEAAGNFEKEFARKRRIVNRSWRGFKKYVSQFDLQKHFKFLFELVSHKVLRWFNWIFLVLIFLSNVVIVFRQPSLFYLITLSGQVLFGILALWGGFLSKRRKELPTVLSFPYYFLMSNYAAFLGIWDEARGVKHVMWDHVRHGDAGKGHTRTTASSQNNLMDQDPRVNKPIIGRNK